MTRILFAIPAGTRPSLCSASSCRKTIYWIVTGNQKRMPVDVNVPEGKAPTRDEPGHGVPHWATCPEADAFR
jgi:hypothetical protein